MDPPEARYAKRRNASIAYHTGRFLLPDLRIRLSGPIDAP
jgi:hypothetical protein